MSLPLLAMSTQPAVAMIPNPAMLQVPAQQRQTMGNHQSNRPSCVG
jgi:hypothetical protein